MADTAIIETSAAARAVIAGVRDSRAVRDAAEVELVAAAVEWTRLHPVDEFAEAAVIRVGSGMVGMPIAGPGAPEIAEDAVAEFALALGLSTDSGKAYLGHAVELHSRLPKLWAKVVAGELPVWRARRIAEATLTLTPDAAAHVDRYLAPVAHKAGPVVTDRLVTEAIARFMPDRAEAAALKAADGRYLAVEHEQVSLTGTSRIHGELDLADALAFDEALSVEASRLAALGHEGDLDVRRAHAAGELARRQLALDLNTVPDSPERRGGRPAQQVVLYVHLSEQAVTSPHRGDLATVDAGGGQVLVSQVRDWCTTPGTSVSVRPVIDLNDSLVGPQYRIPTSIAEHVTLRDRTCVFPHCTRRARRCDLDHIDPYPSGETSTENIAPLCRRHHRLKTHTAWTYRTTVRGIYVWTSPHGYRWQTGPEGTTELDPLPPPMGTEPDPPWRRTR